MRLKYQDDFKKGYRKIIKRIRDPKRLNRELGTVVTALQLGHTLSGTYVINRIPFTEAEWYECFVYYDEKHTIIIQYRIKGGTVYLATIGTPSELTKTTANRRPSSHT